MPVNYEQGYDNFNKLLNAINNNEQRNEATTRLQIIDRLLFECLGWDQSDCVSEEPHGNEFSDYTMYAPRRVLIIEAKKEGLYFDIPAGFKKEQYKIKTLLNIDGNTNKAISQAMNYCQKRGVPIGAISNGKQLIVFIASRGDGIPPEDGRAVIFSSLEYIADNFISLWQFLSKPGIQERKLELALQGFEIPILPPKMSSNIENYPGLINRNIIQTDLEIVSDLIIEEVTRQKDVEEEFVKQCYCSSGALSQYALVSKSILQNRYAAIFDKAIGGPTVKSATTKKGLAADFFSEPNSTRPIILLGDVGVGKTMFLKHFIHVEAKEIFNKSITLYFDLGSKAAITQDVKQYFINDLIQQLRTSYNIDCEDKLFVRGVYNKELERFAKSIYGPLKDIDPKEFLLHEIKFLEDKQKDRDIYIKDCLNHISKGRNQQIVIILDNADQREEEIQEKAFLISREIATHWPVTAFLTLRPQTFYRSKKLGALSGYHPKAFTISPPRVDEVIRKRLSFAIRISSGEIRISSLSVDISIKLQQLKQYLEIETSAKPGLQLAPK